MLGRSERTVNRFSLSSYRITIHFLIYRASITCYSQLGIKFISEVCLNDSSNKIDSGTLVGDYKVVKVISQNKSGDACLAVDTQLDKEVILKFISKSHSTKDVKPLFELSHPNIVSIFETGDFHNQNYLVMDYINGKKLSEFIDEGSVSDEFAIDVAIQLSDALAYVHSENIIHGGITSSNIIIDIEGRPKLTDFGLYAGKKKAKDDLGSIGALLYEMLSGKAPADTINPATIKTDLAGHSEKLVDIIIKLVSNKKDSSYETAEELYNDLVKLPQSKKLSSQKPVDWWNRTVVPAAVIVILIVAFYWLFIMKE